MSLDDQQFDFLMRLKKEFKEPDELVVGPPPLSWHRDIISLESKDTFILDYYRGEINISKYSMNKRYRTAIVMVRLCSHGIHTNPDGKKFIGAHLHMYKDGFDDRIAQPISVLGIDEKVGIENALAALLKFCNVQNMPVIQSAII